MDVIPKRKFDRLLILSGIFCWGMFIFMSYLRCSGKYQDWHFTTTSLIEIQPIKITLFLNLFLGSIFWFQKRQQQRITEFNLQELVWSTFVVATCCFIGLALSILIMALGRQEHFFPNEKAFIDLINNINVGFLSIFAAKAFYSFKRMILFQRTKLLNFTWNVFEALIYISLIINWLHIPITHPFGYISLSLFVVFTIFLSLNMPWVAYLNVKQKWKTLLYLGLILLVSVSFADYIYDESAHFNNTEVHLLVNDLLQKPFIINTFIFIVCYSLTSILILVFNLPTSSVFEQKMGEVFSFQRLNQIIHSTDDVKHIYQVLLDTSMSTTLADSAWLEIVNPETRHLTFTSQGISKDEATKFKLMAKENKLNFNKTPLSIKDIRKLPSRKSANTKTRSLLFIPLFFQEKRLGTLCICKNVQEGFDDEIIEVISSFAGQASLSIENSRLMHRIIETERYKEEIKIARDVKRKLLSGAEGKHDSFESSIFTNSADDVGGDYYGIFQINTQKTLVIIADVAGHGTSAAFNMAQLKGIVTTAVLGFTSHLDLLSSINISLGHCLDKQTFITLTSVLVDNEKKTLNIIRAGHCPSLFYNDKVRSTSWIDEKQSTIGLGIIRSDSARDHLEEIQQPYITGDMLVLYTDGLIEAKNELGEDFGEKEIEEVTLAQHHAPKKVVSGIIETLHEFTRNTKISDDYTLIVLKFN